MIREEAAQGKPILGICLGMQLLFEESREFGTWQGLGRFPGQGGAYGGGCSPGV